MPKSLHGWLHYQALKWLMPEEAVQEDHGGIWHKVATGSWTQCDRWVAGRNLRQRAGFARPIWNIRRSPWWGTGSLTVKNLCVHCFAVELPILIELEATAISHTSADD